MMNSVYITGIGAITASGRTADASWQSIIDGRSNIGAVTQWDLSAFPYQKGAEVPNYKARELVKDRKLLKLITRQDVLGLAAADEAIQQSGILDSDNSNTGVFVGSPGNKYFQQYDFMPLLAKSGEDLTIFADKLFDEVHPMWLLKILPNNVLAYTGIQYGFKGPNQNITNHVVSGLQALIEAYHAIQTNQADRAVVIAYDVGYEPQAQGYYGKLGILSNEALKPFDTAHNGTILGEGAAAIVLESEQSLNARGAHPLAQMKAGMTTGDAQGIFSVDQDAQGLMNLVNGLMNKAKVSSPDLAMLVAHGNGNAKSDITESIAYAETTPDSPVTGFKWSYGHTLCASGLLDTVMAVKALCHKTIPGIATFEKLSVDCRSIAVSKTHRETTGTHSLIINRGFGGLNSGVVICDTGK